MPHAFRPVALLLMFALLAGAPAFAGAPASSEEGADTAPATATDEVAKAIEAAKQAELDLRLGVVRVGLLKARAALMAGQPDESIAIAVAALSSVESLPRGVDKVALSEPLESIIDQALEAKQPIPAPAAGQVVVGAGLTHQTTSSGTSLAIGQAGTSMDLWASTQVPDWAIEDPLLLSRMFLYPSDWEKISLQRRSRYGDGIIYAGPETVGSDGRSRQTVVYDIQELIVPIPSSASAPHYSLRESTRNLADRIALRESSLIFRGSARDLAEGIPLLHYFGGVDDANVPYGNGEAEYDRLLELIELVAEDE